MEISPKAIELIIGFEVSSQAQYDKLYQKPTWPLGESGVTIGIGYDLGYVTKAQFREDWGARLNSADVQALEKTLGKKGVPAKAAVASLKAVRVPWAAALAVYKARTIPKYAALTAKAFPGVEKLSADCRGALVSLVFNRGASLAGDRRREMRQIRDALATGHPEQIPALIRAMKRLWIGTPNANGLGRRRDAEAALFESGLKA